MPRSRPTRARTQWVRPPRARSRRRSSPSKTQGAGCPTYSLKYWGKQTGTVGIAYQLAVNLRLTLGTPNTYAVSEFYQNGAHHGGGTFTFDPATKRIEFTKTCGEINVGLGNVDKGSYTVTPTEFKVFNFGLYGAGDILIFNAPL